jgi:hypothetical protein
MPFRQTRCGFGRSVPRVNSPINNEADIVSAIHI